MYKNIGLKIKSLAMGIAIFMAILDFLYGIILIAESQGDIVWVLVGVLVMLIGPVITWISSWMLYGFGELIDKAAAIERNTRKDDTAPTAQPQTVTPDIVKSTINRNY